MNQNRSGLNQRFPRFCFCYLLVSFWLLLGTSTLAWSAEYSVSLLSNQTFTTLESAEAAMRAVSVQASHLQFKEVQSQTLIETVRLYNVPSETPTVWWTANIGNTGPGPNGRTAEPGGNCQSCLQASGGFNWTGVLTPIDPFPFDTFKGCQFTQRDGTVQNNGCVVGGTPFCREGFSLAIGNTTCINLIMATIMVRGGCPAVAPLIPLDPAVQPYEDGLIDMDNLTQATREGAACIVRVARARHLSPRITSGYRPPAYQTHIREVYDNWQLLENNNDAACADTKRKVKIEFDHHAPFAYQPGQTSPHSLRRAVDISLWNYADADTIAAGCNMSRSVPNDRVHFESPR